MAKSRIDLLLVQRGFCETRAKAQARILAGDVLVEDRPVTKAGTMIPEDSNIRLRGETLPYVSRGGLKLEGALDAFGINPDGWVCFDAGSSTGGFTDCLLQRGATKVYAVDVGTNQLHWKLRSDARVVSMEHVNLRSWNAGAIPEKCRLLVADLSFISLRLVIPPIFPSLEEDAQVVLLVKPQFEAGRGDVGTGGIVRDPEVHRRVLQDMWSFFSEMEFKPKALACSPIQGGDGNREFFIQLERAQACLPFPGMPEGNQPLYKHPGESMNPKEAFSGAIAFERRIRDFYVQCAREAKDPKGQRIFAILAREEEGHVNYLADRLTELEQGAPVQDATLPTLLPAPQWIKDQAAKLTHTPAPVAPIAPMEMDFLKQALEMERATSAFYRSLVEQLDAPHQHLFQRFLDIEDGHVTLVQAEINALAGLGHWFDFMEFSLEQ